MQYSSLNAEQTLALGQKISTTLAGPDAEKYPIPAAVKTLLAGQDAGLSSAIANSTLLASQSKAATVAKADARDASATTIASIHATLLNSPAVTDEMIVALGLTPRRGGGRPQPRVPAQVGGVVAVPGSGSTAKISWKRDTNGKGTMFVVEASPDGVSWTPIKTTQRTDYVVENAPPGVATFFRVTATTSTNAAIPSETVGVYLPSLPASPVLKLAA